MQHIGLDTDCAHSTWAPQHQTTVVAWLVRSTISAECPTKADVLSDAMQMI